MRYAADLQLEEMIIHIVDRASSHGLILSQRPVPLLGNERLVKYMTAHIQKSLRHPLTRAASFVDLAGGPTANICTTVLDGSGTLVDGSRALALQLAEIIEGDGRISPGALTVCLYRDGQQPQGSRYLALLKMDPSDVFQPRTEHDPEGNLYVNFEVETTALPSPGEGLQKCAFIQPLSPRPEYDMLLLDRQTGSTQPEHVASFFVGGFLGAQLALDPRQRTERFYAAVVSATNTSRTLLSRGEEDLVHVALEHAITSTSLNIDDWLAALPLPSAVKEQINDTILRTLPDREFEVDAAYAQRLTRKRRFRGDHGLKVEVSAEERRYQKVIHSVRYVTDELDVPPYYEIVIHTEKWDEVLR